LKINLILQNKFTGGNPSQVFDIAVHPRTLQKLESNELFRQFIFTAAMEGIQNKYSVNLKVGGNIFKCVIE